MQQTAPDAFRNVVKSNQDKAWQMTVGRAQRGQAIAKALVAATMAAERGASNGKLD